MRARLAEAVAVLLLALSAIPTLAAPVHGDYAHVARNATKAWQLNRTRWYWVEPLPPIVPVMPPGLHVLAPADGLAEAALAALSSARGLVPPGATHQYREALGSLKALLDVLERYSAGNATRGDVARAAATALSDLRALERALLTETMSPDRTALLARVRFAEATVSAILRYMLYWALPVPLPVHALPARHRILALAT